MKKLMVLLLSSISLSSFAGWETIKGNGVFKKETRKIEKFSGLQVQGSMNVQLAYGNSTSVSVEADENLLSYIETFVENDKLVIRQKKGVNLKSSNKMIVYASLTRLSAISLSGSGNVQGQGAFSNNGRTEIQISGSGNIKLGVDNLNEISLAISGSGNIQLKGNQSNNITAAISGSGNIDCSDLKTNDVFAKVSGSGDIKVYASKSIDAKVSGSGNIYYKGTASNINMKAAGSGKIIKV